MAAGVLELLWESVMDAQRMTKFHRPGRRSGEKFRLELWNPATGETWSGRGRMPRWLEGKDIEPFRIIRPDAMPPAQTRAAQASGEGQPSVATEEGSRS